jgi:hypothetical protein
MAQSFLFWHSLLETARIYIKSYVRLQEGRRLLELIRRGAKELGCLLQCCHEEIASKWSFAARSTEQELISALNGL